MVEFLSLKELDRPPLSPSRQTSRYVTPNTIVAQRLARSEPPELAKEEGMLPGEDVVKSREPA